MTGRILELGSARTSRLGRAVVASPWRIFGVAFVVLFGASAIWSAATPIFGAPDEPSHIVRAAAVIRGEWTASCFGVTQSPEMVGGKSEVSPPVCTPSPNSAQGLVEVPLFYAILRQPDTADPAQSPICFHAHQTIAASCAVSVNTRASATQIALTDGRFAWVYDARYPPLYYAIVGLPTLLGYSSIDLYLMRLVSAALTALFLALAFTACAVYSRNRLLLIGLVVAVTPMVLFLGGVVNPSGLEISSAIAVWTTGAILFSERTEDPPRALVAMLVGSAMTLELSRSISPLWLALSALFLIGLARRRQLFDLLRRRQVRIGIGAIVVAGGLAVTWTIAEHATLVYPPQCITGGAGSFVVAPSAAGTTTPDVAVNVASTTTYTESTFVTGKKAFTYTVVNVDASHLCVGDDIVVRASGHPLVASSVGLTPSGFTPVGAGSIHGTVTSTSPVLVGTPTSTILERSFQHNVYYLPDMIGVFGWFDTYVPYGTYLVWYGLIGLVAIGALAVAGRRRASLVALLAVAIVVVPVLISSSQALRNGYIWSGRDALPLAVGLPLFAAAAAGTSRVVSDGASVARRLIVPVVLLAVAAQFAAFFEALRRYAVGTLGSDFSFIRHPAWHPAIGIAPALLLEAVALIAFAALVVGVTHIPTPSEARSSVTAGQGVEGASDGRS